MRGKFPQTVKHFNSPKNDVKSSLGYFQITGTLPMSLNCILKNLRKARVKFPAEISPGIPQGKEAETPHSKFPFISPEFPQGNHEESSAGMIPWNSLINPRGNLGSVDGSPAG